MTDHYTSSNVAQNPDGSFEVVFGNKAHIKLSIPLKGAFEKDPNKEIDRPKVDRLARVISVLLNVLLEE
jgi:hypothetical protein